MKKAKEDPLTLEGEEKKKADPMSVSAFTLKSYIFSTSVLLMRWFLV